MTDIIKISSAVGTRAHRRKDRYAEKIKSCFQTHACVRMHTLLHTYMRALMREREREREGGSFRLLLFERYDEQIFLEFDINTSTYYFSVAYQFLAALAREGEVEREKDRPIKNFCSCSHTFDIQPVPITKASNFVTALTMVNAYLLQPAKKETETD